MAASARITPAARAAVPLARPRPASTRPDSGFAHTMANAAPSGPLGRPEGGTKWDSAHPAELASPARDAGPGAAQAGGDVRPGAARDGSGLAANGGAAPKPQIMPVAMTPTTPDQISAAPGGEGRKGTRRLATTRPALAKLALPTAPPVSVTQAGTQAAIQAAIQAGLARPPQAGAGPAPGATTDGRPAPASAVDRGTGPASMAGAATPSGDTAGNAGAAPGAGQNGGQNGDQNGGQNGGQSGGQSACQGAGGAAANGADGRTGRAGARTATRQGSGATDSTGQPQAGTAASGTAGGTTPQGGATSQGGAGTSQVGSGGAPPAGPGAAIPGVSQPGVSQPGTPQPGAPQPGTIAGVAAAQSNLPAPAAIGAGPTAAPGSGAAPTGLQAGLPAPGAVTATATALGGLRLHAAPSHLTLRLHPAELGQLDIRLSAGAAGPVITITTDRRETLALLQADVSHLHAAMDRAGLGTEGRVLHLTLDSAPPATAGFAAGGQPGHSGQPGQFGHAPRQAAPAGPVGELPTPMATAPPIATRRASPGGVDLTA